MTHVLTRSFYDDTQGNQSYGPVQVHVFADQREAQEWIDALSPDFWEDHTLEVDPPSDNGKPLPPPAMVQIANPREIAF